MRRAQGTKTVGEAELRRRVRRGEGRCSRRMRRVRERVRREGRRKVREGEVQKCLRRQGTFSARRDESARDQGCRVQERLTCRMAGSTMPMQSIA